MVKLIKILLCSSVFSIGLLSNANAALATRLGGLAVYDTDLNITWLADADYAKTSGYDADGLLSWPDAKAWAAGLSIEGVTGWRLPTADTSCTNHCSNSEMGHLYYDELRRDVANYSFFSNIRYYFEGFYLSYWTGTEFTPELGWTFFFANGHQGWGLDTFHYGFAWAVHDGDVGASLVPEPETYAMMSIGLLALFGFIRLRQQSEPQNNP